jgi:phage regulator Rha-like protein
MNMLSTNTQQTMTTREIAELTGKEHKNVKRDCEVMFREIELDKLKFERIYLDKQNRKQSEYALYENLTMTLITGYSIKLRSAVIARWKELETQSQPKLPQILSDPNLLRNALLEYSERVINLEETIQIQAPKVEFYDKMIDCTDLSSATQVASKYNLTAKELNSMLFDLDVYSRGVDPKKGKVFRKWFIQYGYGEMKHNVGYGIQPMFTAKGEQWIFDNI